MLQAATLGVKDRVDFVGPVSNVAQYIRASDLFVLSSRWEGFPLVLLEALALGVPAVATRVEGVPLVVRDGETGWLVAPGNVAELAERMTEAASDPSELRRRGRAGAQLIREEFSSQRALDQIDAFLRETVAPLPLRHPFSTCNPRVGARAPPGERSAAVTGVVSASSFITALTAIALTRWLSPLMSSGDTSTRSAGSESRSSRSRTRSSNSKSLSMGNTSRLRSTTATGTS